MGHSGSAGLLDGVDQRAEHLDAREVLVVRLDERPRADVRARSLDHVVDGFRIGVPPAAVPIVLLANLEALELDLLAPFEARELFVLADREPQLDDNNAAIHE